MAMSNCIAVLVHILNHSSKRDRSNSRFDIGMMGQHILDHEWLCLNEREDRLDFDRDSDTGEITLYDPDLYAIPD